MSKQSRVRQARSPSVPELEPMERNGETENRKTRRAKQDKPIAEPKPTVVEITPAPHLLIELTGGRPNVRWVNGADPFAAPMHLEMAIEVVKDFIREQLKLPKA